MQYSTRLPATPLITHDPYFSIWAPGDTPTAEDTVHWSGTRKILRGSILVDGVERGFLSRGLRQAMRCVDTRVTPLSTEYILEDLGVRLSVKFTSPLLLDDLDVLSTPISYIDVDVSFIDGAATRSRSPSPQMRACATAVRSSPRCGRTFSAPTG